jgi:hypothetical protein
MDGKTKLVNTTLSKSLNTVCLAISEAMTDGGRDLTIRMVQQDIPDAVFTVAVYSHWLPEPTAPASGAELNELGGWVVEKAYRESFVALIADSLSDLMDIADDGTEPLPTVMPSWADTVKASLVRETSSEERVLLVERYLARYKHPIYESDYQMQELHWRAAVSRRVFDGWRRGEIRNNTKPGRRILDLLERNKEHRKLRPRKHRENWRN